MSYCESTSRPGSSQTRCDRHETGLTAESISGTVIQFENNPIGGRMSVVAPSRRLNHVEIVHRPGERHLVRALFDLLGFGTLEMSRGEIVIGVVDPPTFDELDNDNWIGGREVRPEQWEFDQALAKALQQKPLAAAFEKHKELLSRRPQWGMHFGFHFTHPSSAGERSVNASARVR